jgi:hypothetical protein
MLDTWATLELHPFTLRHRAGWYIRSLLGLQHLSTPCIWLMSPSVTRCIFDPNFASVHATPASVDELSAVKPLLALGFIPQLKAELPLFLSAAVNAPTFDRADVAAYTEGILTWWRTNCGSFKSWALAARIVFAISPNSASCERVFSLLKLMFGEQQISTLADAIRAALMLRYNNRVVG